MEKEKKTVTVEIPEGKKAVWNEQGILQLVDEKKANEPKDVTERIKTFYDAYSELTHYYPAQQKLIEEYDSVKRMGMSDDIVAYMQLRIITAVLNEGWEPQFKIDETLWIPHFVLWTEEDIDEMSDDEKDENELFMLDGSANVSSYSGFTPSCTYSDSEVHEAFYGSRLAYKSQELAEYAGCQFASIYARFYLGDKASNAMPWREFEQKHRSSGDK